MSYFVKSTGLCVESGQPFESHSTENVRLWLYSASRARFFAGGRTSVIHCVETPLPLLGPMITLLVFRRLQNLSVYSAVSANQKYGESCGQVSGWCAGSRAQSTLPALGELVLKIGGFQSEGEGVDLIHTSPPTAGWRQVDEVLGWLSADDNVVVVGGDVLDTDGGGACDAPGGQLHCVFARTVPGPNVLVVINIEHVGSIVKEVDVAAAEAAEAEEAEEAKD